MASVATKRRTENKSCKIKYKTLKKLEKGILKDFSLYSKFGEAMMRSLKELISI